MILLWNFRYEREALDAMIAHDRRMSMMYNAEEGRLQQTNRRESKYYPTLEFDDRVFGESRFSRDRQAPRDSADRKNWLNSDISRKKMSPL